MKFIYFEYLNFKQSYDHAPHDPHLLILCALRCPGMARALLGFELTPAARSWCCCHLGRTRLALMTIHCSKVGMGTVLEVTSPVICQLLLIHTPHGVYPLA